MSGSKPILFAQDLVARLALNSLSKFALADLVVDLLRRNAGDEHLDGEPLAQALVEAFEPVAAVRGDRVPNLKKIAADVARRRAEAGIVVGVGS